VTCADLRDLLSAYADGQASPAQRELLDLHLERCRTCQMRLGDYRRVGALLVLLPGDAWAPEAIPSLSTRPRAGGLPALAYRGTAILVICLVMVAGAYPLRHQVEGIVHGAFFGGTLHPARSTPGQRTAAGLPPYSLAAARSTDTTGFPVAATVPGEDRGAIVVVVYRGNSQHAVLRRRMQVGRVDSLMATWADLVQVLQRRDSGSAPVDLAERPAAPSGWQRGGGLRWASLRAI